MIRVNGNVFYGNIFKAEIVDSCSARESKVGVGNVEFETQMDWPWSYWTAEQARGAEWSVSAPIL